MRASGDGAGVDFQVFSEHLPPTSPICRHLPRFSPYFLLQSHTHTHINAHPVKNNQQPPISFWHAKEGTLEKKKKKKMHKMLRQIVLHTFSSGIYYASTTHSPAHFSPVDLAAFVGSSAESWTSDSCSKTTRTCWLCICMNMCVHLPIQTLYSRGIISK